MDPDDFLSPRQNDPLAQLVRQDLDPLSVDELRERIATLQSEIARCEAKIAHASSYRSIADSLFKKT
jgi:uncharacterized small protein (DUF1192 family)